MEYMGQLLTDAEVRALILMTIDGQPTKAATKGQMLEVVKWAERVKIDYSLLENVLLGHMNVRIKKGVPVFQMTEAGNKSVEALIAT